MRTVGIWNISRYISTTADQGTDSVKTLRFLHLPPSIQLCKFYLITSSVFVVQFHEMKWSDVIGWVGEGGALLGTKRSLPKGKFAEIAQEFRENDIQGLLIVGGFEVII